jgi:ribonuclease J
MSSPGRGSKPHTVRPASGAVTGPTVTFLGGVREIGGNKILVQDGPDRVLFDFGPSFSPRREQFYVDFLQPRSSSPVEDLLEFDLLPRVEGLYSRDALQDSDLPWRSPEVQAVFVSHAHIDHAGHLGLIDPEIPVYLGEGTRTVLETIESSSPSMKYGEHPWRTFRDRTAVKVGRIEVVPYPVDHSVPFAYGFLVRTSEGTIVYTGDFRQHGPRAADTHAFFAAAKAEEPRMLLIEGTRAGPDRRKNFTEEGVRDGVDGVLADCRSVALACTYPRDVDRLRTLHAAAVEAGRTLLVSPRTAYLLGSVAPRLPPGGAPVVGRDRGIAVYARKKRRLFRWEAPLVEGAVSASEVRRRGQEYLLALDLAHFPEMIDLRPPKGSPFVHSMSEPFSEDDVDDRVMHNWLEHFGLDFHQMHASGHASDSELRTIVREVGAAHVYPIHTEHPEAFEGPDTPTVLPELNRAYAVR